MCIGCTYVHLYITVGEIFSVSFVKSLSSVKARSRTPVFWGDYLVSPRIRHN